MADENQLPSEDTLIDRGVSDVLDEGYSPPERSFSRAAFGSTETLDQRLAEEEPDPASRIGDPLDEDEQWQSDAAEREAEFPGHREIGRVRAGRLVAPDLGFGEDTESDLVAEDVGISGERPRRRRRQFTSSTSRTGPTPRTDARQLGTQNRWDSGSPDHQVFHAVVHRHRRGWRPRHIEVDLAGRLRPWGSSLR